jgi:hypothetical protein
MPGRVFANAVFAAILIAVTAGLMYTINRSTSPYTRPLPPSGTVDPDYADVLTGVTAEGIQAHLDAFESFGPRLPGTEGASKAADYIAGELRDAGYEVYEQPFEVTLPVTRSIELLDAEGVPLDGVTIHPMTPNRFRTCTTPPDGLTGTVLRGERGLAREFEGRHLAGNFALLPVGRPWHKLAGMGAEAIFYFEETVEKTVAGEDGEPVTVAEPRIVGQRWDHSLNASLNVPRFLVRGDVEALQNAGEVTVRARVDWMTRISRNIVGVLPVTGTEQAQKGEATLFSAYYDSYSYVPDLAYGAKQACGAASLLEASGYLAEEHRRGALTRSTIVAFTGAHGQANAGMRYFLGALGSRGEKEANLEKARERAQALADRLEDTREAREVLASSAYWEADSEQADEAYWADRDEGVREEAERILFRVIDREYMEAREATLQAKVDWVRDDLELYTEETENLEPERREHTEIFKRYTTIRKRENRLETLKRVPAAQLKGNETYSAQLVEMGISRRCVAEAEERIRTLAEATGRRETTAVLAETLLPYRAVTALVYELTPASGRMGLVVGEKSIGSKLVPADNDLRGQFRLAARGLDGVDTEFSYEETPQGEDRFFNYVRKDDVASLPFRVSGPCFESLPLAAAGHTAFSIATLDDSREKVGTPRDTFRNVFRPASAIRQEEREAPIRNLLVSTRLVAAVSSRLARGQSRSVVSNHTPSLVTINGQVVSTIGDDLVPSHEMPGAVVRLHDTARAPSPGFSEDLSTIADWDGDVTFENIWPELVGSQRARYKTTMDAALADPQSGRIHWVRSPMSATGEEGVYSIVNIPLSRYENGLATAVVFRAAAVQIFPMPDPTNLQPYASSSFMEKEGLSTPPEFKVEPSDTATKIGGRICYVPPESRLYFTFKNGSLTNPNLHVVRAFALNAEGPADGSEIETEAEIAGPGYLAADHHRITNVEFDVARSMSQVNNRRVALQKKYGMADRMILDFNQKAIDGAERAKQLAGDGRFVEAKHVAAEAIAYASNIHPVIRKNASDAIVGILFYLFLAIPFTVFMEKLLVGHPDIRYQLLYEGAIFMLFFVILWAVHPAFQLVRSAYMILLGFVTCGLAAFVGIFVSARFSSNVSELHRRHRREVETADVSRAGAASTAFVLGLNNMRKRAVRTGLTVVTLILITFVMICFTSVRSDLVETEYPVGHAPYTGFLVRERSHQKVDERLLPLQEYYGEENIISPRCWGGRFAVTSVTDLPKRADFNLVHELSETNSERAKVHGLLGLSPQEPMLLPILGAEDGDEEDARGIFTGEVFNRWFEDEAEKVCYVPRPAADRLRLDEEAIRDGTETVRINNVEYTVLGIFDPMRLDLLRDIDGESIVPVDIMAMSEPPVSSEQGAQEETASLPEDQPRLPGEDVLIMPYEGMAQKERVASIAVKLTADKETGEALPYREAREVIEGYLERSGEASFFGLDEVAFYGGRFRSNSMEGFLDLLLPILLSALTVLNTMRGSVYERRNELYVFNAVGLAPNHIRFLFLAEACVYAVVGAVGGYLLAQGIGTGLDLLGVKQMLGLSLNYSSLSVVFVTLVIMAVVFLSSIFPARMASQLAAPAETMTRERESSEGDQIELDLPFVFNRRDRIAIIPYFVDWFENFGEGSSGEFFCSPPEVGARAEGEGHAAPFVRSTTWLKPYDLGVSQEVEVIVRHDEESGDNIATAVMTRKSGDRESWERCCYAFIGLLRKRFLTWRAVGSEDREYLLERGRRLIEEQA